MTYRINEEEEERWIETLRQKGLALDVLDWKDVEDVHGVCQFLNVSSSNMVERNRVKKFMRRCSMAPIYRVSASIGNARNVKGFRATTFLMAEETQAHCAPSDTPPIKYGSGEEYSTLFVSLLFESKSKALEFATKIRNWKFNHPLSTSNLDDPIVDDDPTPLPSREDLRSVLLIHYDPAEADDSPCTSLADFRGLSSALPTDPVSLGEPLHKYQCIEKDSLFATRNPYKLHLKDKAKFKELRENENNMLAGSWPFHQLLDGLNTREGHGVPLLSIGWLSSSTNAVQFDDGERRYRVDVQVEFFTEGAETDLKDSLKVGSSRVRDRVWKTFVYVQDPHLFKECIQWKHDEAVRIWDEHLDF
mmetsp:Transcript_17327/g.47308  ORF Transcript_17327/g.47308 Transcript_17327/m.47308 type:complete len:361 (+) Transcript_17327:452-1534(+)|eukprot:CAMPEP_0168752934 /NCGR_PEP_ID=MMETSP0724-20121128/18661_1 /TAXON_ID=265536 /ORGANISM="Amphiprora sp., Strain CCMP467" /LENGTH=360 /DNA_ID=CAMNT_0008801237 /DNA_START=412 /DNA_END=1494 /DNA_ORIENTATION=+